MVWLVITHFIFYGIILNSTLIETEKFKQL
jgi:hypothetical protein